jgi:hypothetical protein
MFHIFGKLAYRGFCGSPCAQLHLTEGIIQQCIIIIIIIVSAVAYSCFGKLILLRAKTNSIPPSYMYAVAEKA